MAGLFELFVDAHSQFRFRLLDGRGGVVAVSSGFVDKSGAVAGIEAARECAGTGLIADLTGPAPGRKATPEGPPSRLTRSMDRPRIHDRLAS